VSIRIAATLLLAVAVAACGALQPSPTPVCWIGIHAEYRVVSADGSDPGQPVVEETGRIIDQRLARMGLAAFDVRTRSDRVVEVDLQPVTDQDEVKNLITASGQIYFVPIPEGTVVEPGDPVPAGLPALFGREGIQNVARATDAVGRAALDVTLTPAAAADFDAFAAEAANTTRQMAIVVDDIVVTAPTINAPRFNGQLQLQGSDFDDDVPRMLTLLELPPLPALLEERAFQDVPKPAACS
jgi:preprotein translocase subunit SecD